MKPRKSTSRGVTSHPLPVDLAQHNIDRPDYCYNVGQQLTFAHRLQRLECRIAGVPHMYTVRLRRTIAHDVVSHLATRRLHRLVHLARWNSKAFSHNLKVMD